MYEPITEEQLTTPRGMTYVQVIEDAWWPHDSDGNFYFYRQRPSSRHVAPQCNHYEQIARSVGEKYVPGYAGVKQIPIAFVPINPSDF